MDAHSSLCVRMTNQPHGAHKRAEGPVAGRTRSSTQAQTAKTSAAIDSVPSHKHKGNGGKVTKPGRTYENQTGSRSHMRKPLSKQSQLSAFKRLCALGLRLKGHLKSDDFCDYHGHIRFSTYQRIRQLSRLSPNGALGAIPNPQPVNIKSPERIQAAKKLRSVGRTSLSNVECAMTDNDMEAEWGLLPGELHDNEVDFAKEMEVMEHAAVDVQKLEALEAGSAVDGVWIRLATQQEEDVTTAAMRASNQEAKERESAVMDVHCVTIVKSVWRMAGDVMCPGQPSSVS